MQRIFFSNLMLMILLNLLIKPVALFGIDATVQNKVGPENYGLYFSLLNLSVLFNILLDFGINNYTTKNLAQNPDETKKYFSRVFTFRIILFSLYSLFTFTIAYFLGYSGRPMFLLSFLVLNQFLILTIAYFRSHFAGFHFFKTDALISVLDRALLILIGGLLLFSPWAPKQFKIEWFIWIQTFCYISTLFVGFILLIKHLKKPYFSWDPHFGFDLIKKSWPYALLIVLMLFYTRIDGVMIERIHENGAYESGVYAQGFRLLDALYMFGMIFAGLLFPLFSKQLKESIPAVLELVRNSANLLLSGVIIIIFVTYFNASYILSLIYTHFSEAVEPFQFLMIGFFPICMNFIFATLLTANGNLKILNMISVGGICANICINLMLIPKYGALGAAIATCLTQMLTATLQYIYCVINFKIPVKAIGAIKFGSLMLGLYVVSCAFQDYSFLIPVQLLVGLILTFSMSLIDLKSMKKLYFSSGRIK